MRIVNDELIHASRVTVHVSFVDSRRNDSAAKAYATHDAIKITCKKNIANQPSAVADRQSMAHT